jgi:hypothetical protein
MQARWLAAAVLLLTACSQSAVPRDPDPENLLPLGHIDVPTSGATVGYQMLVQGWALDDGSVSEVRIFLDSRFVARTTITEPRPDVRKVYPLLAQESDIHGWTVTVPLGAGTLRGPHTILVQAFDNQGASHDIGTVNVTLK